MHRLIHVINNCEGPIILKYKYKYFCHYYNILKLNEIFIYFLIFKFLINTRK